MNLINIKKSNLMIKKNYCKKTIKNHQELLHIYLFINLNN